MYFTSLKCIKFNLGTMQVIFNQMNIILLFFNNMLVRKKNVFLSYQIQAIQINHSSKQQVFTKTSVTWQGSQFEDGLRSSRYPHLFSATSLGILIEQPLFATPAEKSWIEEVSCKPVRRLSLSFPVKKLHIKFRTRQGPCNQKG